jgi:hypothetical protein
MEISTTVDHAEDIEMSDDEGDAELLAPSVPGTPALQTPSDEGLKRKRNDLGGSNDSTPAETPMKRMKEDDLDDQPGPPPPPPPPPVEDLVMHLDEEAELAAQEEALMRENEEALIRENEEAMHDAELKQQDMEPLPGSIDDVDAKVNSIKKEEDETRGLDEDSLMKEVNGIQPAMKMEMTTNDLITDLPEANSIDDKMETMKHERKEVLSH